MQKGHGRTGEGAGTGTGGAAAGDGGRGAWITCWPGSAGAAAGPLPMPCRSTDADFISGQPFLLGGRRRSRQATQCTSLSHCRALEHNIALRLQRSQNRTRVLMR